MTHPAAQFLNDAQHLAGWSSTPGWEDADGKKTTPGAKPIGLAQWRDAMRIAFVIHKELPRVGWPVPGVDPGGFVWLTWRKGEREFTLKLSASLNGHAVEWTTTRDGERASYGGSNLRDVMESLRATFPAE